MAIGKRHFSQMDYLQCSSKNIWIKAISRNRVVLRGYDYIKNLIIAYWQNLFKFASVGASGALINLFILWLLTDFGHFFYIASALIAIEISIIWNFALNTKLTFDYKFKNNSTLIDSIVRYHLTSFVGSIINLFVLYSLTELFNLHYIISETIAILLAFGLNYALSINYVWCKKS